MEAYLERLIQEQVDLGEKGSKLESFMEDEDKVNKLLTREQQKLMYQQQVFMEGYYKILSKRIEIENNKILKDQINEE